MNNTQFYFAVGVPFFTLLLMFIVTTVSSRAAISGLRSEMRAGFSDLGTGLGARMDRIEKKLETTNTEIRINHHHRLAVFEARVLGRVS